jgi:GT2 family glycosyltransferase
MKIAAIVLQYDEPGWTEQTYNCLPEQIRISGAFTFADRHGVGNMSKAFNNAYHKLKNDYMRWHRGEFHDKYPFVFWATNVTFDPDLPQRMVNLMLADSEIAAVHASHNSDHKHLQPGREAQEVPFVELTCAVFSTKALYEVGLMDEDMPYWGMDLDWSYRAKQKGYKLYSHPGEVQHTYLRHIKQKHFISGIREQLRTHYDHATRQALEKKYGNNWRAELWP